MEKKRKAAFLTLGCKVNQYETDAMKELLTADGYDIVSFREDADVYIVNTCSVTNIADRKSRQMLHRARREHPDAVVVAAGCYVQTDSEQIREKLQADILLGNNKKNEIASVLRAYFEGSREKGPLSCVADMAREREYETLSISRVEGHTRAYIKIQDGCNQFCSYCVIPYARGRIRSRMPEDILSEVRGLVSRGFREIILTGIHISSYGKDLEDISLEDLLKDLNRVEGLDRIRLSSMEPRIITPDFVETLLACDKVCPHFHLSLQSGCDETLARMNRKYTTRDYEEAVKLLRRAYDRPALTTDVIAGFVGETDEEFEKTVKFLKKIRLYEMHIFKYSVREGTRAASMSGHLPMQVKTDRARRLHDLAVSLKKEYEAGFLASEQKVLIEEEVEEDGVRYCQGYTDRYLRVRIPVEEGREAIPVNELVKVKITDIRDDFLTGSVLLDG